MRESIGALNQHDANTDSGYGRSSDRLFKPRQTGSHFPYKTPDAYEDDDDLDLGDSEEVISKKHRPYNASDPLAFKGTTPFYFAAGNTKLSDCFERPDDVLREVESTGKSMSPKHKSPGVGRGAHPYMTVGSAKRTGTTRGWASPPPPVKTDRGLEELETSEEQNPLDWVFDDPHESWIWDAK